MKNIGTMVFKVDVKILGWDNDDKRGKLVAHRRGVVEVEDRHGVVRGLTDRVPPRVYLRRTRLTMPSPGIVELASHIENQDHSHPRFPLSCITFTYSTVVAGKAQQ